MSAQVDGDHIAEAREPLDDGLHLAFQAIAVESVHDNEHCPADPVNVPGRELNPV